MPFAKRAKIISITNMKFTNQIGKYLGFKMFQGKVMKDDFNDILDRVNSKLASWKGRLLNKPGRLTLANWVLASMPTYGMQTYWFPTSVCDHLDRTICNFIWEGHNGKGMHMLGWSILLNHRERKVLV